MEVVFMLHSSVILMVSSAPVVVVSLEAASVATMSSPLIILVKGFLVTARSAHLLLLL